MAKSLDMRTAVKRITSHAYGRSLLALQSAADLAALLAGQAISAASLTLSGNLAVTGDITRAGVSLPSGIAGYAERTTNQASITTEVDLTGLSVTWSATSTRRYRISSECYLATTVGTDTISVKITDSSNTQLQSDTRASPGTSSSKHHCSVVVTGLSGSTTVKLRALRASGTGTVTMQAGATFPAYLLVEDLGPA